ncbi:MAG: phosphate signaling complex protein PhoU [Gammaproteobacteria bacterium]|jgi:phosphate transport system protein
MNKAGLGEHIHHRFDRELDSLRNRVVSMGGLVESQVNDALTALRERNFELAEFVIRTDHRVNAQEVCIDEDCTYILARRQPAAGDLRMVMAIIKTITDIERMGDESEKIAQVALDIDSSNFANMDLLRQQVDELGQMVLGQLHEALDAFVRMDTEAALNIARKDQDVDKRYFELLSELIGHMKAEPADIEKFQSLIWVIRALERIGDHAKNICEYIVYLVRGKDVRHITIDEIEQHLEA